MIKSYFLVAGLFYFSACLHVQAASPESTPSTWDLDSCLRSSITGADDNMSVAALKKACTLLLERKVSAQGEALVDEPLSTGAEQENKNGTDVRFAIEALNRSNRFMLTPHRRNYILPITYKKTPNNAPYVGNNSQLTDLKHSEAEFQLSIKILLREGLFKDNGHLYLGYTNHVFWQVYDRKNSAPFRETNQEPELILSFHNDWEIFGFRNTLNQAVINHQSNGQSGDLSRSWNRLMLNTVLEKENLVVAFTPWYRIPEDKKNSPDDALGDDNPDIVKFMGNFQFTGAYKHDDHIYSLLVRNNLRSDNKGAVELSWSFPFHRSSQNLRGYIKYFNGYGHSLIDYNDHAQVLGLGVVFTDLF